MSPEEKEIRSKQVFISLLAFVYVTAGIGFLFQIEWLMIGGLVIWSLAYGLWTLSGAYLFRPRYGTKSIQGNTARVFGALLLIPGIYFIIMWILSFIE